jgi:hypothetical protein
MRLDHILVHVRKHFRECHMVRDLGMLMHSHIGLLIVHKGSMAVPAASIMKAQATVDAIQTVIRSIHTAVRRIPLTSIAE